MGPAWPYGVPPPGLAGYPGMAPAGPQQSLCLRLCASIETLPVADCLIPERCDHGQVCARCGRLVHHDPAVTMGPEVIVCDICFMETG